VRGWRGAVGRLQAGAVAALLVALLLVVAFGREFPAWRFGGASSRFATPVGFNAPGSLCPPAWQTIELRGDSLVTGSRMGVGEPYGAVMAQAFGGVAVRLRGRGGATAADGEAQWRESRVDGDILLLAYGTNDAAVRGWMGGKTPVPVRSFRESMLSHIHQAQARGANVGLIVPPPTGSVAMMDRLQPYRLEVQRIGRKEGIPVFDPAEAFSRCRSEEPLLAGDALHLNPAGHACLGRWMAQRLCQ
jgi:lysophospholipase L1-like esterase